MSVPVLKYIFPDIVFDSQDLFSFQDTKRHFVFIKQMSIDNLVYIFASCMNEETTIFLSQQLDVHFSAHLEIDHIIASSWSEKMSNF